MSVLLTAFVGALSALLAASVAIANQRRTLRSSFRPLLRPVQFWIHGALVLDRMVVKNLGKGPALSVVLFADGTPPTVLAKVDAVECLGAMAPSATDPGQRVGREWLRCPAHPLEVGREYHLAYQDLEGTWHLTTFTVAADGFKTKHRGHERWRWPLTGPRIPEEVKELAFIGPIEGQ